MDKVFGYVLYIGKRAATTLLTIVVVDLAIKGIGILLAKKSK